MSHCPRSSLPAAVLAWLATALPTWPHTAHLGRMAPRRFRWTSAWTPSPRSSSTGCRTGAPGVWSGSPRPRSATASTCCSAHWPTSGSASPTARSPPPSTTCASGLGRWPHPARQSWWMGWRPGCSGPEGGPTRRCWTTPRSPARWTAGSVGWPRVASTGMRQSAIAAPGIASTDAERAFNRVQAGLRAGGAADRPSGQSLGAAPLASPGLHMKSITAISGFGARLPGGTLSELRLLREEQGVVVPQRPSDPLRCVYRQLGWVYR